MGNRARIAIITALALGAWLALAVPAGAATTRLVESSFDGSDTPGGAFGLGPFSGAIVDNSSGPSAGDLYVGETKFVGSGESRVVKFDASGAYAGVEFTGADTPGGSFTFFSPGLGEPGGLAVDGSSGAHAGDVYVADPSHKVVDRFDEEGHFLCQISGKTPAGPTEEAVECAGAIGSATVGTFEPNSIAVDPVNGDIYVGGIETLTIDEFNPAGEYVGQIADSHLIQMGKMAFDSNGALYVNNGNGLSGGTDVIKFDPSGAFAGVVDDKLAASVAVDPATNHVFVYEGEGKQIAEYDESGALLTSITPATEALFPPVLSAGASNDKLYAAYLGFPSSSIDIYGPPVIIPDATVKPPSNVEETSATLNGEVALAGGSEVESCEFEYGAGTEYNESVACAQAPPFADTTAVSAPITGLEPSTEYHFRLVVSNANGVPSRSQGEVLYTKGPPTVQGEAAHDVTRNSATIEALVNPHGFATEWKVEYVTQAQFEANEFADAQSTETQSLGPELTPQAVSVELSNLAVETTYHYRVVATSSAGTTHGSPETFITVPVVERIDLYPSAENTSALLRETVNPLGLGTTCQVEYTSDAAFQGSGWASAKTAPCTPANLTGSKNVRIKTQIRGLAPTTTYHSRFTFTNSSGTSHSPDRTFTTFGLKNFSMALVDEDGEPVTQAGSHPYEFLTEFVVTENEWIQPSTGSEESGATATIKNIHTELPPGLIGNPNGLPQCPQRLEESFECPADTQVGAIAIALVGEGKSNPDHSYAPMFNLVPPKGVAAKFGANINIGISAYIESDVRTGKDYGINADSLNVTSFANAGVIKLKLWGNPGDQGHTKAGERACPIGGEQGYEQGCEPDPESLKHKPFLSLPTSCTGQPLQVHGSLDTYQEPANAVSIGTELPAVTGCNAIEFDPSLEARPTTNVADSPTGLQVDLHVPQAEDENGLRVADLRDAKVTLPPGLVINPSGANGLVGCSAADFDEHGTGPAHCPDQAKIGTAEVVSPLIGHPLPGAIYIANPFENPFGSLLAIYVGVYDPISGVVIKLAGHVEADPQTGQLTTTFDENPQLPFNDFKLNFFHGAKAPLRTPAVCGQYQTTSVLTPWSAPESGPAPTPADHYGISQEPGGGSCPTSSGDLPNAPAFNAGTVSPIAGKYSPTVIHLRREDGSQEFEKLTITPPPGLLAKLAGTTYCSDSDIATAGGKSGNAEKASPSCPASSEVGTVHVAAGAGPAPYYVDGHAYLAGPYKGAPLSLAIITPATAGPFDLGTVVVRAALQVNPETTQITAVSDPIPHILQGIPLDIRSISVELAKNEFTLNGTSCKPMSLTGQLGTTLGATAALSNPFQLGNCTNLGFKPQLQLSLKGSTKHAGHPALKAVVTYPKGAYANIASAQVNLPHSEFLDQGNLNKTCTKPVLLEGKCTASSQYGTARAWSPLLEKPLEGPVYLVGGYGYKLPALVAELNGQIRVLLVGKVDSGKNHGIRNTFEVVPDAPVEKFVLEMKGGKKYGLLENSENLCKKKQHASALFTAQNGKVQQWSPVIANQCKKKAKGKHKAKGHGHGKGKKSGTGRKR